MDLKLEVSFCECMGFKESELRCIGEERKGKSVRLSYTILKDVALSGIARRRSVLIELRLRETALATQLVVPEVVPEQSSAPEIRSVKA